MFALLLAHHLLAHYLSLLHSHTLFLSHYHNGEMFVSFSTLPGGFCIQSLQLAHAESIAHCYPYYEPGYHLEHFKSCLVWASVGVFTETTSPNLVCWILRDYDGSLHHLYTVEQYRRRGLASAVVRMMCKHNTRSRWCAVLLHVQRQPHLHDTVPLTGFTESQEQFFFSLKTDKTIDCMLHALIWLKQ